MQYKMPMWAVLIVAAGSVLLGIVGFWYLPGNASRLSESQKAESAFGQWQIDILSLTAADARSHWQEISTVIENEYATEVPDDRIRLVNQELAAKFIYEEDIKSAFRHLLLIPPDRASFLWDLPMLIYIAGEAGAADWLAQLQDERKGDKCGFQDMAVHANILWVRKEYEELLHVTRPDIWESWVEGIGLRQGWIQWLQFRRAQAFVKLGKPTMAQVVLDSIPFTPLWLPIDSHPAVAQHCILEMANIAIQSAKGKAFQGALRDVAQSMRKSMSDKSAQMFIQRIDETLQTINRRKIKGTEIKGRR